MRNVAIVFLFVFTAVWLVQSQGSSGGAMWSLGQVENMVQPIALYPDPLLNLTLQACTQPSQIVAAADYLQQPEGTRGSPDASWSPAITGLLKYPTVLHMLDAQLSWAVRLGSTYQSQAKTVHDAINAIRQKAQQAGTLASGQYQTVTDDGGFIGIQPCDPGQYWVPYYDPAAMYNPGYVYGWRHGFVAGYAWRGHVEPYHPYAHPYHPAYSPAYRPEYNAGGYPGEFNRAPVENHFHFYGDRGVEGGGMERGLGGFAGGFHGRR